MIGDGCLQECWDKHRVHAPVYLDPPDCSLGSYGAVVGRGCPILLSPFTVATQRPRDSAARLCFGFPPGRVHTFSGHSPPARTRIQSPSAASSPSDFLLLHQLFCTHSHSSPLSSFTHQQHATAIPITSCTSLLSICTSRHQPISTLFLLILNSWSSSTGHCDQRLPLPVVEGNMVLFPLPFLSISRLPSHSDRHQTVAQLPPTSSAPLGQPFPRFFPGLYFPSSFPLNKFFLHPAQPLQPSLLMHDG